MEPKTSTERFLVPSGLHHAICYGIVRVGTIKTEYKGTPKMRDLIYILFELPHVTNVFNEEKGVEPAVMSKKFTFTFSDRGSLLDFIKTWSNGKIDKTNIGDVFKKPEKLAGTPCQLQVIQEKGENSTYAYIKGIIAITNPEEKKEYGKDMLHNPVMIYDVNSHSSDGFSLLPEWLQNIVKDSQEYKELGLTEDDIAPESNDDASPEEDEAAF